MKRTTRFSFLLDFTFSLTHGMIEDGGEDSCCASVGKTAALAAVFDGCGGLGLRTYQSFGGHTGAYIAARLMSGAMYDWFQDNEDALPEGDAELAAAVNGYFAKAFEIGSRYAVSSMKMKGSMVRVLPTTAAIAVVSEYKAKRKVRALWAGDSRVYLLDSFGLHQLTEDDVQGQDAMSNLTNDGVLTNVLSADGRYTLHCRTFPLPTPCLVFAATDGCFGYLTSPMEFEYVLLSCLEASDSAEEYRKRLYASFGGTACDDYSLSGMAFGFRSFESVKSVLNIRKTQLEEKYIRAIRNHSASAGEMWEEYRYEYYKFISEAGG